MSQNPYAQQPDNAPPTSGGGSMLKVILFILLGVFVLCGGICGGTIFFTYKAAKNLVEGFTSLQGLVQSAAKAAPQVKDQLGEPLNFGNDIRDFKMENNAVQFQVPVNGPKGGGELYVESHKQGDDWKLTKLQLKTSDGQVHDLDVNAANAAAKDPTNVEIPLPGLEEEVPAEKK